MLNVQSRVQGVTLHELIIPDFREELKVTGFLEMGGAFQRHYKRLSVHCDIRSDTRERAET